MTILHPQLAASLPRPGWDVLAADGTIVRIRPVVAGDETGLQALNQRITDRSIYLRFFSVSRLSADTHTRRLTTATTSHLQAALLVETTEQVIGVANFEQISPDEAEMAFLIDDTVHGHGIGTLLLENLASIARERGIRRLRADVLAENGTMLRMLTASGFQQIRSHDSGIVEVIMDTDYGLTGYQRMVEREGAAQDQSLRALFAPRSVAVIGAGRKPGGIGHEVLSNLVNGGFTGTVFAVNPSATMINTIKAYPSIADIPAPVDLVVIAVPAAQVAAVLAECGRAGVHGAVILSSGFGESGAEGLALQHRLVTIAREHSMRLIGPNCLGIANTSPHSQLNATFADLTLTPGSLALAAQSGAVGLAVLDQAGRAGLGISEFVSLGNKADVSGNDLLLHWWHEPRTRVIGLYLESFGNPRKFGRIARQVGRTKPILVVKGGRSVGGRRAGASHTAAAATSDTAVDALFAQSGLLRMDTVEELIQTARVLADLPLPRGRRLAVVGNAGGAGVLAADAAELRGITIPEFSADTQRALSLASTGTATGNPTDLGAAASAQVLEQAVRIVLASDEVDALLVTYVTTRAGSLQDALTAIGRAAEGATIPVILNCIGAPSARPQVLLPDGSHLPVFPFPEAAVQALGHAMTYAEWRNRPDGVVPLLDHLDLPSAKAIADTFLSTHEEGGWLDHDAAEELIRCAGIGQLASAAAATRQEAAQVSAGIGFPVAVKTAAAEIVHKTDVHGVRLGLADLDELEAAYDQIKGSTGSPRVTIQAMAPLGVELVVGLLRDPLFGPVLMAGSGGVLTDVLADRVWRALPLTDLDAAQMLRSLRSAPLLAGYRGMPAADEAAVLDVVHRIAWLADAVPEIVELDVNPLLAAPAGAFAVDVKIRITPAAPQPDWFSRHLR